MNVLGPGWPVHPGAHLIAEGLHDAGLPEDVLHMFQSQLSALLLACAGFVEAAALALEGNSLTAPAALTRQAVEHAAAIVWMLEPGLNYLQRIARAVLFEDESLELDLRARDVDVDERLARLEAHHGRVRFWFTFYVDDSRSLMTTREMRNSRNEPVVGSDGVNLSQPRLDAILGQRVPGVTAQVASFYRLIRSAGQPYAWLCSRTHANTTVLRRSRRVDDLGRAATVHPADALEQLAALSAQALAVLTAAILAWHGVTEDVLSGWEDDIETVVPGTYEPAAQV